MVKLTIATKWFDIVRIPQKELILNLELSEVDKDSGV